MSGTTGVDLFKFCLVRVPSNQQSTDKPRAVTLNLWPNGQVRTVSLLCRYFLCAPTATEAHLLFHGRNSNSAPQSNSCYKRMGKARQCYFRAERLTECSAHSYRVRR